MTEGAEPAAGPAPAAADAMARVRALLAELADTPLEEQPGRLEDVHRLLVEALAAADGP